MVLILHKMTVTHLWYKKIAYKSLGTLFNHQILDSVFFSTSYISQNGQNYLQIMTEVCKLLRFLNDDQFQIYR